MNNIGCTLKVLGRIVTETGNSKMPVQQVALLLHVMNSRSPVPMQDLIRLLRIEQSSVSRNCALLGPGVSITEAGYGLLETFEDPHQRSRKLVKLTPRGELLRANIVEGRN